MNRLTEEEFDDLVYDREESAVIFFHREGCSACAEAANQLESLSEDKSWTFAEVDALEEKELFARFRLNGVPQVLFFRGGRLLNALPGKRSDAEYLAAMNHPGVAKDFVQSGGTAAGSEGCREGLCYFCDNI
ncbi:MAG: thioredoxin family protein [Fretibacterium sp.]|nr:thioredoxin family protein [Fretibacterium sp.]